MSCRDSEDIAGIGDGPETGSVIRVGGISADLMTVSAAATRAGDPGEETSVDEEILPRVDAEEIDWLRTPLFDGLDITYGKASDRSTSRVAVLKLLQDPENSGSIKYSVDGNSRLAEYSFMYRDDKTGDVTSNPAIWYDNGAHFFEGLYLPNEIKYDGATKTVADVNDETGTAPLLNIDQHNDATTSGALGNYRLLSRYLGMPSGFTLNATVARVKLPFRHRLARVLAYILIDPIMGNDVTIKGYSYTPADGATPAVPDDPTDTEIRFCNVGVLAGVKDIYDADTKHHTYTPQWTETRKAIPHFVGERGSYDDSKNESYDDAHFIAYYDTDKKTYIYPTDTEWSDIHQHDGEFVDDKYSHYERTRYGTVPVYDLIVRPTYSAASRVMYDEEGLYDSNGNIVSSVQRAFFEKTNQIEFEITLNNGLNYTKVFEFDLDANYQTVVYLHISRERVDYNSSGNSLWQETLGYDDYYGVNNQNGNTLSFAGSSWQRAYRNSDINYNVTDGHQYLHDTEDEYAQYVTDAKWIEMFREAHEGGLHHGDYFILDHDIEIPAAAFPDDFVFTGHLDGQDHTITITDGPYNIVTQQASHTYVDYDNKKANPGDPNEQKYSKVGNYYIELDTYAASMNWYERDVSETGEVTYTRISDIYEYDGIFAFVWTGDGENEPISNNDEGYTEYHFYKQIDQDEVTTPVAAKPKPYYLFAGLNGKYSTTQEANIYDLWEANVHLESSKWVPYKCATDGWRAEIINTNFGIDTDGDDACSVFKSGTVWGTDITGYLHNCWINSTYDNNTHKWSDGTPIENYTPSIPEY